MTNDQQSVLQANAAFYEAFSMRDIGGMEDIWSSNEHIAVIHPGWPPLVGRKPVISSWRRIMEGGMSPAISIADSNANVLGGTAIVICTEVLTDAELVATNIFKLEKEEWKLVHHQSGPLPQVSGATGKDQLH